MSELSLHFESRTDVGRVRQANEDYFLVPDVPGHHVYVVCDGMGGHIGGAEASKIASTVFAGRITESLSNGASPDMALNVAIQEANSAVYARAQQNPELSGMGTTLVALLVRPNGQAFCGHVGDSRLYRIRSKRLVQFTRDDSYVQDLIDRGELDVSMREQHPEKNRITKALGIDAHVAPTVKALGKLKANDVMLLCSDGLSGVLSDAHMLAGWKGGLADWCNDMVGDVLRLGAPDNVTLIAVQASVQSRVTRWFKAFVFACLAFILGGIALLLFQDQGSAPPSTGYAKVEVVQDGMELPVVWPHRTDQVQIFYYDALDGLKYSISWASEGHWSWDGMEHPESKLAPDSLYSAQKNFSIDTLQSGLVAGEYEHKDSTFTELWSIDNGQFVLKQKEDLCVLFEETEARLAIRKNLDKLRGIQLVKDVEDVWLGLVLEDEFVIGTTQTP